MLCRRALEARSNASSRSHVAFSRSLNRVGGGRAAPRRRGRAGAAGAAAGGPRQQVAAPEVGGSGASAPPTATSSTDEGWERAGSGSRASASSMAGSGALGKQDYPRFVQFFRSASPYIEGHRGRTFVIVIPGEVLADNGLLQSLMSDIALLHGLGIRLVVVLGAQPQINEALRDRGVNPQFVGSYRVTSSDALEAAVEAAGRARTAAEQYLSRGPSVPVFRRHSKSDSEMHFGPALSVVSGNYVAAKRRGIVDGVDFGFTGEVRFVAKDAIRRQLDAENIVLLSHLGFTAAGEVLNCNTYDVGLHAAAELRADKIICLHLDDVARLALPAWLPLSEARAMLLKRMMGVTTIGSMDADQADALRKQLLEEAVASISGSTTPSDSPNSSGDESHSVGDQSHSAGGRHAGGGNGNAAVVDAEHSSVHKNKHKHGHGQHSKVRDFLLNLDLWHDQGFPTAVSVSVVACSKGVKRAHLVDARIDGGMLLELYSRDGIGTMISTDFYEGIRRARAADVDAIQVLLTPLEKAGTLVQRSREELRNLIYNFTVIERETKVMGCALLLPLGVTDDGERVAEIGAFCVDPVFRGSGRGDSLLDYVEQEARQRGLTRLVLLTTRTADWFVQRDFQLAGPAWKSKLLPAARRAKINPARNSQLYVKALHPPEEGEMREPGKRIGF